MVTKKTTTPVTTRPISKRMAQQAPTDIEQELEARDEEKRILAQAAAIQKRKAESGFKETVLPEGMELDDSDAFDDEEEVRKIERNEEIAKERRRIAAYEASHVEEGVDYESLRQHRPAKKPVRRQVQPANNDGHMRRRWNDCEFEGYLIREPDCSFSTAGNLWGKFTIAVYQGKLPDGSKKKDMFINCVAFGVAAEYLNENVPKGAHVHIQGQLKQDQWKDGSYHMTLIVDAIELTDRNR